MKRLKLAIGIAVIAFLLTSAASTAWAVWSSQAGVTSSTKVATLSESCSHVTSVQNASFEQPVITPSWTWVPNGGVPGWVSTDPVGIEIWQSGFNGVVAPVGKQFVELNANVSGTLSQTISTTPGQILQWSLLHRARVGTDTMQVLIGSSDSTLLPIRTISDGTSAWGRYSGAYVVPEGQATTELAFRAISTGSGDLSVGNFMDDVSFGSGPCLTAASTVSNVTNPGSSAYHIGDTVKYSTTASNIGSSLSYRTALSAALPAGVAFKPGSLSIDGVAETDASGDDQAEYTAGSGGTGTIGAQLGSSATGTSGGTIAQGTSVTLTFEATVVGPIGSTIHLAPSVDYRNNLAPLWPIDPAVAPDAPFTVTVGVDVGITAGVPTPATLTAGVATPATTWTFIAKNNGAAVANNVVVHLTTPPGFTQTTGAQMTGGVACTTVTSTTTDCTIGNLAAGATNTITLSGYAAALTAPGAFAVGSTITTASGDPVAANNAVTGIATVVPDTTAPSTVSGLAATGTTGSQTTLAWNAASDNAGVVGYNVYRGGVLLTSVAGTTFTDTLLTPSTAYTYTVKAKDAAGNLSTAFSNSVVVTTASTFSATTFYRVSFPGSTFCVSTGSLPPVSTSTLVLSTCDTTQYQKWAFLTTLNGHTSTALNYYVAPQITGTLLSWDVLGTGALAKADVKTATNTVQQWKPVVEAAGTFHFVNLSTGLCLDVNNGVASAGLQLQQFTCNNTAAQSFAITGVN